MSSSVPNLTEFRPLPGQLKIIRYVRTADYKTGVKEILLSGSVGSSKSLLLAHLAITHCFMYPGAIFGIGRLALPQLKNTLTRRIREHLRDINVDYRYVYQYGGFKFPNGSIIQGVSWADGNLEKLGSQEFSAFAIEELTETKDSGPYDKIIQRVGRLPHVKESFLISATNPDGPSHWAYKKLVMSKSKNVKVFYSRTDENPYLPPSYIDNLKERLDPKEARRMIYGEWVDNDSERIYYCYNTTRNFRDWDYKFDESYPLRLLFDFNIGDGKPLSLVLGQYIERDDSWHFFDEVIIDGQRTVEALEESNARGLLDLSDEIVVHGDATGGSRDTRSFQSDYEIIDKYLSNLKKKKSIKMDVPRSNPPIRERHNLVNAYCLNSKGDSRLFVYRKAKTVDEGLQLTRLKSSGSYLENDSDRFQHCTTAIGYGICMVAERVRRRSSGAGSNIER